MADEKLQIIVSATDQASGVLKQVAGNVRGELKAVEQSTAGLAGATKTGFAGMAASAQKYQAEIRAVSMGLVAVGAVTVGVAAKCIAAYGEQEIATAKLSAAIRGTAQAIDQSRLEKLAADLQKASTFGDEAIMTMEAMLVTFNLTQDQVEQLAPRILNISAIMGTDLQSAAIAVGKAISTANWGALTRFGIIIDEDTQKSGDFADILKAIDRNTGPAAEALAKTGAGAMMQFKNAAGDAAEEVGKALVPALTLIVKVATPVVKIFGEIVNNPLGRAMVLVGTAAGLAAGALGAVGLALPAVIRGWVMLTGAQMQNAVAARAAAAANLQAAGAASAAGAAAAGAGASTAVGGAVASAGRAGLAGTAARAAGRYVLPALIAYEGTKLAWGTTGGDESGTTFGDVISNQWKAKDVIAAAAKPGEWKGTEQGRAKREAAMAALAAAPGAVPLALPPPYMGPEAMAEEEELWQPSPSVAGIANVAPGTYMIPAGHTGKAVGAGAGDLTVVGVRGLGAGRYEIVLELQTSIPPGAHDDLTNDYLGEAQYLSAGVM